MTLRNVHRRGALIAGLVLALVTPMAGRGADRAEQQVETPPNANHLAFSGYWRSDIPPQQAGLPTPPDVLAKMLPWAASEYAKKQAASASGQFLATPNTMCMPAAVPGTGVPGGSAYAMDILVEPRQVTFLYEENRGMRFAYLNAQRPMNLKPSWTGYSVARWDGDTLIVDTFGFNDDNEIPVGINLKARTTDELPMSAKMHIVERYRLLPGDILEDQATFDDPGAFTAPFELTRHFKRSPPFQEFICQENNHEGGFPTADGRQKPNDFVRPVRGTSSP